MDSYKQMAYSALHPEKPFHIHMNSDSLDKLNCLFHPEGKVALQSEEQTRQCNSVWSSASWDFASSCASSLQNKLCSIGSDVGFIISSGTIRWAGERLVWTCLSLCHLELRMGGNTQLLPQCFIARQEAKYTPTKTKKPGSKAPATEEGRAHNDTARGTERKPEEKTDMLAGYVLRCDACRPPAFNHFNSPQNFWFRSKTNRNCTCF